MCDVGDWHRFGVECLTGCGNIELSEMFSHKSRAIIGVHRDNCQYCKRKLLTSYSFCVIYKTADMTERELRPGVPDRPRATVTPEMHRARFEELAGAFTRGEFDRVNEDGSLTQIVSYERHVDPLDR